MQAPLKERYRESPEAAVVTLHAAGTLGEKQSAQRIDVVGERIRSVDHDASESHHIADVAF